MTTQEKPITCRPRSGDLHEFSTFDNSIAADDDRDRGDDDAEREAEAAIPEIAPHERAYRADEKTRVCRPRNS